MKYNLQEWKQMTIGLGIILGRKTDSKFSFNSIETYSTKGAF